MNPKHKQNRIQTKQAPIGCSTPALSPSVLEPPAPTPRIVDHTTLQHIVRIIVQLYSPDKIILLGHINQDGECFSIFTNDCLTTKNIRAALIMFITHDENLDRAIIGTAIEQRCRTICDITCIIHYTNELKILVEEKNRFAIQALQSKQILYQKWVTATHIRQAIRDAAIRKIEANELITWHHRSCTFHQTAIFHEQLGNYGMAAFCIHQAIEQLGAMLHQVATGYRLSIHNLERQLRSLRFFYQEITDSMIKRTPQEEQQFQFLSSLYITYRYKQDVCVTKEDLHFFICELKKVQSIADRALQLLSKSPISSSTSSLPT